MKRHNRLGIFIWFLVILGYTVPSPTNIFESFIGFILMFIGTILLLAD
jgi:hypothetical protein